MSELEPEEKAKPEKIYPTPVKRFILTVIGLLIFIIIGEIAPRFIFDKEEQNKTNVENSAKPQEAAENPKPVTTANSTETSEATTPSPDTVEKPATEPEPSPPPATEPTTELNNSKQTYAEDIEHLRALEEKIATLQASHETAISELQKKLETQSAESQHKSDSVISSLIIFGQLKDAVSSGKPYADELNQLKKTTADNVEIAKSIALLEPDADKGITVADKLKANFPQLIKQALTDNNESAWLKILHKFITIRKVGEQSGSTDEAILARGETKLAQNDLGATLSELEQLSPEGKDIFKDWRESAQKLLDTEKALSNLQLLLTKINQATQP